jgi:hypothetical protein
MIIFLGPNGPLVSVLSLRSLPYSTFAHSGTKPGDNQVALRTLSAALHCILGDHRLP